MDTFAEQVQVSSSADNSSVNFRTKNIALQVRCISKYLFKGTSVVFRRQSAGTLTDATFETSDSQSGGENSDLGISFPSSPPPGAANSSCSGAKLSVSVFSNAHLFGRVVRTTQGSGGVSINGLVTSTSIGSRKVFGSEGDLVEFSFTLNQTVSVHKYSQCN